MEKLWKDMTKEERREYKRERQKQYRRAAKLRGVSATCASGGHASCGGQMVHAVQHVRVACQCYCHIGVCALCKQPTMRGFRKAIHDSANALEAQAKQIRKFVECTEVTQ
jgi:hypothetical protein